MTRNYGAALPLLDAPHEVHALLVEVETFASTLRYNTSGWDLEWFGQTWLAGGNILGVEMPEEDANMEAHKAVITVSSLTPSQTSLALSQNLHGRYAAVYDARIDVTDYQIKGVARDFSGRVSNLVLNKAAVDV